MAGVNSSDTIRVKNPFGRLGLALLCSFMGTLVGLFGALPFGFLQAVNETLGLIVGITAAAAMAGLASLYAVRLFLDVSWIRTCIIMRPYFGFITAVLLGVSYLQFKLTPDTLAQWHGGYVQFYFLFVIGAFPAFLIGLGVSVWGAIRQRKRFLHG
jgi:hypothetical protein